MTDSQSLKSIVAPLLRMGLDDISEETSVVQFNASLERTKLGLGLRRIGLALPTGSLGPRYGDLEVQLGLTGTGAVPTKAAQAPAAKSLVSGPSGDIHIGIDIESVAGLPDAADPWEDDFYKNIFTPAEIAHSMLQSEPRTHLCGAWCAKEALRKSGPAWIDIPWQSIELTHREDGAPTLKVLERGAWQTLPCAVSISHTSEFALAVVAWGTRPTDLPAAPPPDLASLPQPQATPDPSSGTSRLLPIAISLIAFAISLFALIRAVR